MKNTSTPLHVSHALWETYQEQERKPRPEPKPTEGNGERRTANRLYKNMQWERWYGERLNWQSKVSSSIRGRYMTTRPRMKGPKYADGDLEELNER